MLTNYLDKYPVLLDNKKDSKKFQIFKKMQMDIGATQTEPYLALCHMWSTYGPLGGPGSPQGPPKWDQL